MADRLSGFGVLTLSSIASSVADSLYRFVEELPDAAREARGVMGMLFEMKTLLRELDLQFQDPRCSRLPHEILDNIIIGIGSCSTTLRQLDGIVLRCNATRRNAAPNGSAQNAWDEIQHTFRNLEGSTIPKRLDLQKKFLFNLARLLQHIYTNGRSKKVETRSEREDYQEQIRRIAVQQEKHASKMRDLEDNHRRAVEEQIYMSRHAHAALPSPPYDSPPRGTYTPGPSPYQFPIDAYRGITGYGPTPPLTPVSPISPVSPLAPAPILSRRYSTPAPPGGRATPSTPPTPPVSTRPRLPRSAGHPQSSTKGQWWSEVFSNGPGSTTLSDIRGDGSKCTGMPMETLNLAPEEHEIFRVELDNDLTLRMFRNETTAESKVVCTVGGGGGSWSNGRRNGYRFQTFIDASLLTISRVGSAIHLKRRNISWAELYFADYETTVLFYHAFLALRYYGPNSRAPEPTEHWLNDEELKFSATINENGYVHLLRLLKDRSTGCIRLAAAFVEGEYDVTLWTAFITKQICSADWMYSAGPNTLMVKNIRQYSFSSSFETDFWRDYKLRFRVAGDSREFTKAINDELKEMTSQRTVDRCRTPGANRNSSSYF